MESNTLPRPAMTAGYLLFSKSSLLLFFSLMFGLQVQSVSAQACVGQEVLIDFSVKPDGTLFQTGEVVTDQYSSLGVTISSRLPNGNVDTNNPMVIFDSSEPLFGANIPGDPGNGDEDLGTPSAQCPGESGPGISNGGVPTGGPCPPTFPMGYVPGANNCDSLGKVMIFEESFLDRYNNDSIANGNLSTNSNSPDWLGAPDGLDDSPDDNGGGGILRITFDNPFTLTQLGFVDDAGGNFTLKFADGSPDEVICIVAGADNDTSIVNVDFANVSEIDFDQEGSGAVSFFRLCDLVNGEIGDQLYIDNDGSGTFNAGDTPIANIDVTVTDSGGNATTVSTDAMGNYLFENLVAGTYTVEVNVLDPQFPNNTYATVDADGVVGNSINTSTVTLVGDSDSRLDQDFGYQTISNSCDDNYTAASLDWDTETWTAEDLSETFTFGTTEATITFSITGASFESGQPSNGSEVNAAGGVNGNGNAIELNSDQANGAKTITATISFFAPVKNLQFSIYDLDFNDAFSITSDNGAPTALLAESNTPEFNIPNYSSASGTGDNTDNSEDGTLNIYFEQEVSLVTYTFSRTGNNGLLTYLGDILGCTPDASSIGDFAFTDYDNDGIFNNDDVPLAGVAVNIANVDGSAVFDLGNVEQTEVTTDASGNYLFDNLAPGNYVVTFGEVTGYDRTTQDAGMDEALDSDANATTGATASINLPSGVDTTAIDAGYIGTGSIGDQVFVDVDGDGVYTMGTDTPLDGVDVTLTLPTGGIVTVTTGADGTYLFPNLPPTSGMQMYTVTVDAMDLPAGLTQTVDPDGTQDNTTMLTLDAGEADLAQDFGYVGASSIGDFAFIDYNNDGIQDAMDAPLAGVAVNIANVDGSAVFDLGNVEQTEVTTDASGNYLFDNLAPGNYVVTFGEVTGYDRTTQDAGMNEALDSDANATTGATTSINLPSGVDNSDIDAGYSGSGSISARLYEDVDGDGVFTAGVDNPIPNVDVTLTLPNGETVTVETDANGNYIFPNLAPTMGMEMYTVTVDTSDPEFPANLTQTLDPDNTEDNSSTLTLGLGESNTVKDFAYAVTVGLGNFVFLDSNEDGIQDAGELGINGVSIELFRNVDGMPVSQGVTMTTNDVNGQAGFYEFTDLDPGSYYVVVDNEVSGITYDYSPGDVNMNMNETTDSDVTGADGSTEAVLLTSANDNPNLDAGLFLPVVPVELISFTGSAEVNHNQLRWITASEIDNEYFEVHRMVKGGKVFEKVGVVLGNGTTNEAQSYEFKDRDVNYNTTYLYRLKQVDFSGQYEHSQIISVARRSDEIVINVFPNPTVDYLNVDLGTKLEEKLTIRLMKTNGELVKVEYHEDVRSIKIDVTDLPASQYYINVSSSKLNVNKSFIKIK